MASFEDLEILRRKNKELLQKLKDRTEHLQRLHSDCARKRRENGAPESVSERAPLKVTTGGVLKVSDAFNDLSVDEKSPKVVRNMVCEQINMVKTPHRPDFQRNEKAKWLHASSDVLLQARGKSRLHVRFHPEPSMQPRSSIAQDTGQNSPSESIISTTKKARQVHSLTEYMLIVFFHIRGIVRGEFVPRGHTVSSKFYCQVLSRLTEDIQRDKSQVKFPPGDPELGRVSERRCVQPLLGYDWIAGLLDAENSLTERSEHFFSELQTFRQVNKDECVHSASSWTEGLHVGLLESSLEDGVTNHKQTPDTHQCTFCYRINNRLFATPLDAQAACPVCKTPKEKHPHREKEPAFIRVSIPRSTLLPAYRYKAHRRCSFDPSDSLGLPSHCLSGWTNISMGAGSEMSSLDLRSSMEIRPNPETVPSAQLDRSGSRASGRQLSDQLLHVSRLAQYQIQRLAVTRRSPNMSSC